MSTGRSNLNVNERGVDVNWFRGGKDIHEYEQWHRTYNFIPERFDITTYTTAIAYGSTFSFEVDKRGDHWGKTELVLTRPAVTVATNPRFNDWEGYSSIDIVRFWYSNKNFLEIRGEQLYREVMKEKHDKTRSAMAQMQYGFLSDADRRTQANTQTTWVADLMVPWEHLNKRIPMIALPNKIKVDVTLKPLTNCCYVQSGTPTCVPTSATLRVYMNHLTQAKRDHLFNHVNSGNGVAVKITTPEFHLRESVSAVANSTYSKQRIKIRNIKNAVYKMDVVLRNQTDVDNTAGNTLNLWNFNPINTGTNPHLSRFWFEDNGNQITNKIEVQDSTTGTSAAAYGVVLDQIRMHPDGVLGLQVPSICFPEPEFVEHSRDGCFGSRNFSKYNNPEFVFEFDLGNNNTPQYLDLWADVHNLLIYQRGDLRRYLI